jgi:hypothetical protein
MQSRSWCGDAPVAEAGRKRVPLSLGEVDLRAERLSASDESRYHDEESAALLARTVFDLPLWRSSAV